MMSSKNNGFTASDIERYHSGKMLAEERHALEKAALDDPFLADALEGYTFTTTAANDIAKIQSRLNANSDQKKIVPIFRRYKWLSVAAIVLIIAGAGWLTYDISQRSSNNSFTALEKKKNKDTNSVVTLSPNNFHDTANDKTSPVTSEPATTNQVNIPDKKINQVTVGLTSKAYQSNATEKEIKQDNNTTNFSKAFSIPSTQNEVASNNVRASNQRGYAKMSNAVSAEPRLNNASKNDIDTNLFFKKSEDSNGLLAGRVSGINSNDTIKNLNIVLKPLPADSLKEVVVGYGTQKKSTEKYHRVIIDTLEPEEGFVHFDDYVANNLKTPEIRDKPVSGEVQLSFDVDKDGQPTNISVIKSLCQKCDAEAIRLLKEGPKWKKKKNKKGIITIRF